MPADLGSRKYVVTLGLIYKTTAFCIEPGSVQGLEDIMRKIIAILVIVAGIIGGLYVGGWMLFIQPIIAACRAFDAGALTAYLVGITILKCIFASTVGTIIALVGFTAGRIIGESGK